MRYFLALFLFYSFAAQSQQYYLFVGTYTSNHSGSKGIYVYKLDAATGSLNFVSQTDSTVVNPSFLTVSDDGKHLYAVTETRTPNAGSVSAFSFDTLSGKLTFLNKQLSGGENPAFIEVNKTKRWVFSANYSSGTLAAFPLSADGRLQSSTQVLLHKGNKLDTSGKEISRLHSVYFSPNERFVVVPDPGADKVFVYRFSEKEKETPLLPTPFSVSLPSGSFPRHFTFHPNGRFAYSIQEKAGTVAAYRYRKGKLKWAQTIVTHDSTFKGPFQSSDIHTSPDGRFLYAANRGTENDIAIFSVDQATGKLRQVGSQPTLGETPRNFVLESSGKLLIVANQKTGNLIVFRRDGKTGLLTDTGTRVEIPEPSCLKLLEIGR